MKKMGMRSRLMVLVGAFVVLALTPLMAVLYQSRLAAAESDALTGRIVARNQALFALVNALRDVQGLAQRIVREKDADVIEQLLAQTEAFNTKGRAEHRGGGSGGHFH
jgi:sensor histidine kinase regulating citrate/malate metabolism